MTGYFECTIGLTLEDVGVIGNWDSSFVTQQKKREKYEKLRHTKNRKSCNGTSVEKKPDVLWAATKGEGDFSLPLLTCAMSSLPTRESC